MIPEKVELIVILKQFLLVFHKEGSKFMTKVTFEMKPMNDAVFVVDFREKAERKFNVGLSIPEKILDIFDCHLFSAALLNKLSQHLQEWLVCEVISIIKLNMKVEHLLSVKNMTVLEHHVFLF